jgi:hypothetical protein
VPIVVPPGFANVRVLYINGSSGMSLSNSYGVDVATPLTQTDVNNLSSALAVSYKPVLSTGSLFSGIHVEEGQDGDPLVWDSTTGVGAGSRTVSAPATPQVQFLMDKRTALGGRKHRGRTFLGDVAEGDVDLTGTVLAATVTLLTTFGVNVKANFTAGAWAGMCILHSDATVPTPVTTFTPDPLAATLRPRYAR